MVEDTKVYRITVFVPEDHLADYIEKVQDHIPSFLGPYDRVLWTSDPKIEHGIEQFRPLDGSNPSDGEIQETKEVKTARLEFLCPHDKSLAIELINTILKRHHIYTDPVIYYETVTWP